MSEDYKTIVHAGMMYHFINGWFDRNLVKHSEIAGSRNDGKHYLNKDYIVCFGKIEWSDS